MPKFRMTQAKYAKYKKAFILTENTVIGLLLAFGYANESLVILSYKLVSSYVVNLADTFFSK
jgi:hypothetical protein